MVSLPYERSHEESQRESWINVRRESRKITWKSVHSKKAANSRKESESHELT